MSNVRYKVHYFVMWQTSSREYGDFLSTSDGVHYIDGRNSSLYHFFRIDTGPRIYGLTLNVEEVLGHDVRTFIDRFAGAVKNSAQHFLCNWHFEDISAEFALGVFGIDAGRSFENLDHSLGA